MVDAKKGFMIISQIDVTGVRGPHEKELKDISDTKIKLFQNLDRNIMKKIAIDDIGGILENIGFNEDWTITIKFFPEANIHISYFYYGTEFGDDLEAEMKFLFSGDRISWIPGEDSATYIDIVMEFIERMIKHKESYEKSYDSKTELMQKILLKRNKPFELLKQKDKDRLSEFLGAKVWKTTNGWRIKKEIFPEIFVELIFSGQSTLDISYSGKNLEKISSYHIELIGIFLINHVLRYITINNEDQELPNICYEVFSRFFTKQKNWIHRRI